MKRTIWFVLVAATIGAATSLMYGSETLFPARQLEKGSGIVSLFYTRAAQDINLQINSREEIAVNANSYLTDASADLEGSLSTDGAGVKAIFNPHNGLYYTVSAAVQTYTLKIPSGTVDNIISGREPGYSVGFDIRSLVFPDTIVTPAIALEAGYRYEVSRLASFKSGDGPAERIAERLNVQRFHLAALVSKKMRWGEPYGGMQVERAVTELADTQSTAKVTGTKDVVTMVAGVRLNVFGKEGLTVEGSVLGETAVRIGWNIAF